MMINNFKRFFFGRVGVGFKKNCVPIMFSMMFIKGVSIAPHFNTILFAQSFAFFI